MKRNEFRELTKEIFEEPALSLMSREKEKRRQKVPLQIKTRQGRPH